MPDQRADGKPIAEKYDEALHALSAGDSATAITLFEELAAAGHGPATFALAKIYERRGLRGAVQNFPRALEMYMRAYTNFRYAQAARGLGRMYYCGLGVPVDYKRAYDYYSRIEGADIPAALLLLGVLFEKGQGVERDLDRARDCYRRAAKGGNLFARKQLGVLETKRGNLPIGLLLWGSAIVQVLYFAAFKPHDERLKVA